MTEGMVVGQAPTWELSRVLCAFVHFFNHKPLPTVKALTCLSRLRPEMLLAFSMESQFCGLSARSSSQLRERGPDPALAIRVRSRHSLIEGGEGMKRKASAVWRGDVKTGKGSLSTESTVLEDAQYSFSTRFENGIGTNPEELLAAAHAACFAMAVSSQLGKVGLRLEKLAATECGTHGGPGRYFGIVCRSIRLRRGYVDYAEAPGSA